MKYRIGDVYEVDFPYADGSVQNGKRPAVIVQNNLGNRKSRNLIVFPLTSKIKKVGQVTHVILDKECGLPQTSMALCENPVTVTKDRVGEYLTTLSNSDMKKIARANLLSMSTVSFLQPNEVTEVIFQAKKLNNSACYVI